MSTIKIIAIDIDGTLLDSQLRLQEPVKEAIAKAKATGIKIVLCSGRPLPGVKPFLKELNLTDEGDYAITYNGALVQTSHDGKVIAHHTLAYDNFLEVEQAAKKADVHFHGINEFGLFTSDKDISHYSVRECFLNEIPLFYRTNDELDTSMSYSKMMMIDPPEQLEKAIALLPESFYERYTVLRSAPFYLEILNKEASKGQALRDLANYLNVPREEVMAIGDQGNDLDMIQYAGIGVAMGNAVDPIKDASDVITTSNDENGVAEAIYRYALESEKVSR